MLIDEVDYSKHIDKVFKSLIKSGRPDIFDEEKNKSIVSDLYVDLFENNYILYQVVDDNHTLLQGRRGTGKSTIFLRAEYDLRKNEQLLPIYINLQTCYEEIRTTKEEESSLLTTYITYKNFLSEILKSIQEKLSEKVNNEKFEKLFRDIQEGKYINKDFERTIQMTISSMETQKTSLLDLNNEKDSDKDNIRLEIERMEYRVFSIHEILKEIQQICSDNGIRKVYLFLDDFSELSLESQKVVVDSLIAPIISSYNQTFVIKIAAYPGRVYLGNIDKTKLPSHSLDFFDAYDQSSGNYNDMDFSAISYIKRALNKRLEYYTDGKVKLNDLFQIDESNTLETYLQRLFYCSVGILRSLGFVLNYCYLSSINNGIKIKLSHIESASQKYYEENILSDFINDVRFKQSFYDDKTLLDQIAQKNLHDKLISHLFQLKREIIEKHRNGNLKNTLFIETLEKFRRGTVFYLPTSHFSISEQSEKLLKTLELYFIVSKFNEVSTKGVDKRPVYGLNYGLCLKNGIDYGRPNFRRTYDYWRQDDFHLTEFIHQTLSNIEIIKCYECGEEYTEEEYQIYLKRQRCFQCGSNKTVMKINKFESKLKEQIKIWSNNIIPDTYMDVLRVLFNNQANEMTASEIAGQIDKHHIVVSNSMNRYLIPKELVDFREVNRRYYKISNKAISIYFSDKVEMLQ